MTNTQYDFDSIDDVIHELGTAYVQADPGLEDNRDAYRDLAEYNREQFEAIPVDVHFTPDDPYPNHAEMVKDIENNQRMSIFSEGSHPVHMTKEENMKGRAVHDYFGHYMNDCDFSFEGEFEKWYNQREHVPDSAEDILFSEVVGQTALVHHLENGFEDPNFEQKNYTFDSELQDAATDFMEQIIS